MNKLRKAGLVSMLLGATALNSCTPFTQGLMGYVTANDAAQKQSNSTREAAIIDAKSRIEAAKIMRGDSNPVVNRAPRWNSFSCSEIYDFNKDGLYDLQREVVNRGKTEFYVGDKGCYVLSLLNCGDGRQLDFFTQSEPNGEFKKSSLIVLRDNFLIHIRFELDRPASWHAYATLDGVRIADYRINVKENPSKPIN